MGKRYLVDTNIIGHFLSNSLSEQRMKLVASIIDEEFNISVITQIEILAPVKTFCQKRIKSGSLLVLRIYYLSMRTQLMKW
jgi:predicted nucleic acid-binding protein